jgi:hypothetical protein
VALLAVPDRHTHFRRKKSAVTRSAFPARGSPLRKDLSIVNISLTFARRKYGTNNGIWNGFGTGRSVS